MAPDFNRSTVGYSIKAAALATGLSVATLRAWERRYGVIEPKRGAGGHRIYTARDVSRLLRLRETTACGHPIGKIAHLSNAELITLSGDRDSARTQRAAAKIFVARILGSVERFLPADCEQAIAMAFALLPAAEVIREVLSPVLREVGIRWRRREFTIGQERIVSSAVRRHVTGLLGSYVGVSKGPAVVFATLSGERHELGILMCAALAASQTLRVYYMGPDIPAKEIGEYACRVDASAVAISLISSADLRRSRRQLEALRRRLPPRIEIWLGGSASSAVTAPRLPKGTILLSMSREFDQRVGLLRTSGR